MKRQSLFHGMTPKEVLNLYYTKGKILHFSSPAKPQHRTFAQKHSNFGKNRLVTLRFLKIRTNSEPLFSDLRMACSHTNINEPSRICPDSQCPRCHRRTELTPSQNKFTHASFTLMQKNDWDIVFGHVIHNGYPTSK